MAGDVSPQDYIIYFWQVITQLLLNTFYFIDSSKLEVLSIFIAQQTDLKSQILSQSAIKENPRKRPRVPPNSATKEEIGQIKCSVLTTVFFDTAQREKMKCSDSKLDCFLSPTRTYFLQLHGFVQFAISLISQVSALLSNS